MGGPVHGAVITTLSDFFNGGGANTSLMQAFPSAVEQTMRFNTLGGYVADDWKASERLTISLNLRLEHYANPTCDGRCFSRLASEFNGTPNPGAASAPYNQMIITGAEECVREDSGGSLGAAGRDRVASVSFREDGYSDGRGNLCGSIAGRAGGRRGVQYAGFQRVHDWRSGDGRDRAGRAGKLVYDRFASEPGAAFRFSIRRELQFDFANGSRFFASHAVFVSKAVPAPRYYKWNFEIEQAVGLKSVLAVNYSGMHGSHIPVADEGLNAYCPDAVCPGGFGGLPTAPANPALGPVYQYFSAGSANYNGLTISLQRRVSNSFTYSLSYTWSHALDDVSNGGYLK